jgi:hypothetical protein
MRCRIKFGDLITHHTQPEIYIMQMLANDSFYKIFKGIETANVCANKLQCEGIVVYIRARILS